MPFVNLDEVELREPMAGFKVHFVHSEHMTFAHWLIDAGAALPAHAHPHEQVAVVHSGEFELTIGGETQVITPGSTAIIPGNAVHSGRALTACRITDVFYPIREDYR
jgi:quercetin dioxygenase-like cupin family protein